jgi:DNA-binding NarL/FixJ family response regulator
MPIRVVLADDHAIMRNGLHSLMDTQPDIKVVGEAATGQEAVQVAQQVQPDVVVMDLAMPDLNGTEATRLIRRTNPTTEVVILSMHSTSEHVFQALRAGALGFVVKQASGTELLEAIRAVYVHRRFLSKRLPETMQEMLHHPTRSPLERLTARERQVLQLIVEGLSNTEIAARLSVSSRTVITYRSRLMHKLGLNDLPSLVRFAIQHGLTPPT